ncbi:hypothetical protein NEF87_003898 [Candidatus Lokiarchaeum ossiferum]|uniref:Uncharacterized protein n=1 Tax=Candidatus Lokiarchaeum ossiferum TaxID=2951803 RepID=A0ABY6HW86_9ARCH|nr:hypothetical protein NEF87_003898 [Candidatus Lokiarchaeum sp. B-35]
MIPNLLRLKKENVIKSEKKGTPFLDCGKKDHHLRVIYPKNSFFVFCLEQ